MALVLTGLVLTFGLAVSGAVSVVRDGGDAEAVRTAAGPRPMATVLGQVFTSSVPPDTVVTTAPPAAKGATSPAPPATTAAGRAATTTAPRPATTTPPAAGASPATTAASQSPTQALGNQTATAAAACRNSTDPACGPFRFDPQPGADNPMTVEVTAEPASPEAGKPVVFHVTLRDPDGVSYGASNFFFGDSGIGNSTLDDCKKYGPWDPPARDPAHATVIEDVSHTYAQPGSYTAIFKFEAAPFTCTDRVTGRGDRPYSSSAMGSVTIVVR